MSILPFSDYIGDDYVEICECYGEKEPEDGAVPKLSSDYVYSDETDDYNEGVDDDSVYEECCCEWVENPVSFIPTFAPTDPVPTPATTPTPLTPSPTIPVTMEPTPDPTPLRTFSPTPAPSDDEADLVEGFLPRSNDT